MLVIRRFVTLLLLLTVAQTAAAQTAVREIRIVPGPLERALAEIRRNGNIDLVFASRYVDGVTTSCRFSGRNVTRALECAVRGTSLEAVRVRSRQFVLRPRAVEVVPPVMAEPVKPPLPSPTATLGGYVLDAETGDVLPGAIVYLPEPRLGVVTNAGGYFALPGLDMGTYRVQASYVGYSGIDTVVAAGVRVAFRLRPSRIVAPEVVVERLGGAQPSAAAGAMDLSAAQLAAFPPPFGEQDVLRQVEWLPGVSRSGAAVGGVLVRGGEPDENLYLLDGAPVYDPFHAFSLVSAFQSETIKSVRLYRGVFPADYGGRLSSVMAFELKDGNQQRPGATVGASALAARFVVESPVNRDLSFMLAARRSYLDKLLGSVHPVEADSVRDTLRTGYYFDDLVGRLTYRPGRRHRLAATYYRGGDRLDVRLPLDVSFNPSELSRILRPADLFFDVDFKWGNDLGSVRYEYLFSPQFYGTATLYRSRYEAAENTQIRPTTRTLFSSDYRIGLDELGGSVGGEWFAPGGSSVRAGLQASRRSFDSFLSSHVETGTPSTPAVERSESLTLEGSLYAQSELRMAEGLRVQSGMRLSGFSLGRHYYLLPNLSVEYDAVPGEATVQVGVGRQVQFLHRLRDRYSLLYDLVASRWIPASDSVLPATGWMGTGGLVLTPRRGVALRFDAYLRTADNVLLPRDAYQPKDGVVGAGTGLAALLGQYAPATARAAGVEITVQTSSEDWSLYTAYSGEISSRRPVGQADFQGARFAVPHRLEVVGRRALGRWTFTLSGEARSGLPDAVPTALYRLGDGLGNDELYLLRPNGYNGRLPATARLDASVEVRWTMVDASWRAVVQLYNLVNVQNVIGRTYVPTERGVEVLDTRGLRFPLPLFELAVTL